MAEMLVKTVNIGDLSVSVVRLPDRREGSDRAVIHWCFQKQLEDVLYASSVGNSTGAMYKLLSRSAAGTAPSLPLKRASIASGWVTAAEFEWLASQAHGNVRSSFLRDTSAPMM